MVIPLNRIDVGESGQIVWVASEGMMAVKLGYLGFIPDAAISCVLKDKRGGMNAYQVNTSLIGIRADTAGEIFVRKVNI